MGPELQDCPYERFLNWRTIFEEVEALACILFVDMFN